MRSCFNPHLSTSREASGKGPIQALVSILTHLSSVQTPSNNATSRISILLFPIPTQHLSRVQREHGAVASNHLLMFQLTQHLSRCNSGRDLESDSHRVSIVGAERIEDALGVMFLGSLSTMPKCTSHVKCLFLFQLVPTQLSIGKGLCIRARWKRRLWRL